MTGETSPTSPETPDQAALVGQAIETLTALARQTRVRGAGTPSAAVEPVDFADLTAQVLTAVAANLGSVGELLAGRSGSWEADLVRRLVEGTAGDDPDSLLIYRTEPVRLEFDAGDLFYDFGIAEPYEDEVASADAAAQAEGLTDAEAEARERLTDTIQQVYWQDEATYAEAYRAAAQRYLTDRGATCGVELTATASGTGRWDALADVVDEYARKHAPLPMTGNPPDLTSGSPGDALRRAGLTYTVRAQAFLAEGGQGG